MKDDLWVPTNYSFPKTRHYPVPPTWRLGDFGTTEPVKRKRKKPNKLYSLLKKSYGLRKPRRRS